MNSYEANTFYTVPEIGTIKVVNMEKEGDEYSFNVKEMNYSEETEISSSIIPMELLVDFLDISASSDFMSAFEELVKDQEIVIKLCERKETKEIITTTNQEGQAEAEVKATGTFKPVQTASQTSTQTKTDSKTGTIDLGNFNLSSEDVRTNTSISYNLVLEKANTWFMRAQRSVKATDTQSENTEESTIPGVETTIDDAEKIGALNAAALLAQINYDNVAPKLGLNIPTGYEFDSGTVDLLSSKAILQEGTKTVTTKTFTNSYTGGVMKYDDNTDAFLGLWKNKDGQYHKYAPKYNEKGEIVGVAEEACFDPDGKKVGYLDLYNDKKSYTGDLFVNADQILFDLLEMTENTQAHSYTMRYILWRYTGKDYGVTDFDTLLRLLGITTVSIRDYNVNTRSSSGSKLTILDTADGISAEQHLIDGINNIANPSYKEYCMIYVERGYCKKLIELQEKYGVNPAWIVAQSYYETQCGRTGSGLVNNWFGWDVYDGHTHPFDKPEDCFEEICKELADRGLYFKAGNETIDDILEVWCPGHTDEYPAVCKEIFSDILTGAGIELGSYGGGFLEVAKQCHDYVRENNYFYSSAANMAAGQYVADGQSVGSQIPKPFPGEVNGIDCSCYVSWVLYEFKYKELGPWQWGTDGMNESMAALGGGEWEQHSASEAEAGDILLKDGHTEIYIGDGMSYNCGSTNAIRSEYSMCDLGRFIWAWRYTGEDMGSTLSKSSKSDENFLKKGQKVWKEICNSNPDYSVPANIPCRNGVVNCSSFVSWVLYEYGYKEFGGAQHYTVDFYKTNWHDKYGWYEMKLSGGQNPIDYLKPGDLIVRDPGDNNGHITMVASIRDGQIYCYDCGSRGNWAGNYNGDPRNKSGMLTDGRTGKVIRVKPPK